MADVLRMRETRPFVFTNLKNDEGVEQIVGFIVENGRLDQACKW
jgi:urease accessory protein